MNCILEKNYASTPHRRDMQPYDVTTQYQKLELLKMMIHGLPMQQRAFDHYRQANPKFVNANVYSVIVHTRPLTVIKKKINLW